MNTRILYYISHQWKFASVADRCKGSMSKHYELILLTDFCGWCQLSQKPLLSICIPIYILYSYRVYVILIFTRPFNPSHKCLYIYVCITYVCKYTYSYVPVTTLLNPKIYVHGSPQRWFVLLSLSYLLCWYINWKQTHAYLVFVVV